MPAYTAPTWVNGSTVPIDAAHLQAACNALAQALQADGSGPNVTVSISFSAGTGMVNASDANEYIGFGLDGTDVVVESDVHAANLVSGTGTFMKYNNRWNGTNDIFIAGSGGTAYQLSCGSSGVRCRKSTNSPTTGATITWGSWTSLFS